MTSDVEVLDRAFDAPHPVTEVTTIYGDKPQNGYVWPTWSRHSAVEVAELDNFAHGLHLIRLNTGLWATDGFVLRGTERGRAVGKVYIDRTSALRAAAAGTIREARRAAANGIGLTRWEAERVTRWVLEVVAAETGQANPNGIRMAIRRCQFAAIAENEANVAYQAAMAALAAPSRQLSLL